MLQAIGQWIVFIVAVLAYAVGALFNGLIGWRIWVRDESDGPSVAPFLFGLIGIGAVLVAPFGELSDRLPWLWLPLLLDYGSGPYMIVIIIYLLRRPDRY